MASGIEVPTDRAYETDLGHFGEFEAQRWFGVGVRHSSRHSSRHGAERFIALTFSLHNESYLSQSAWEPLQQISRNYG
jgi:hypothetical protein